MRSLVLGATGYVGRHVVRRLSEAGHKVSGLARSEDGARLVSDFGGAPVAFDIEDKDALIAQLAKHETIVWAAQLMIEDERRFVDRALDLLEGTGKTFIFTGGTSLISERTDGDWSENTFAENDAFTPRRQVAPRLETEQAVRNSASRGIKAMCLRPPLIWGNHTIKPIADLYHSARQTGAVCYIGRGLGCYSSIHVEDLADLYLAAIERGAPGALYHSVSGEVNWRMMAETVARNLGVEARSVTFDEACEIWDRFTALIVFGSCSRSRSPRARAELGWAPKPERLDFLAECLHPRFGAESGAERQAGSWVRR